MLQYGLAHLNFRGKPIDPFKLWGRYCDIKEEDGPFLSLTFCPNPDHPNSRTPAFQINIFQPRVHCFAHCGISGSYEHAICVIEGIYEKLGVTPEDIANSKRSWQIGEALEIKKSRAKVRRAYVQARKIIFSNASTRGLLSKPAKISSRRTAQTTPRLDKNPPNLEKELDSYSYLPKKARAYLDLRGIDYPARARWEIGYDEEAERLTIPVRDERNRLLFFIKRGINSWQKPSYLYPPDSPKSSILFGACALDKAMVSSKGLILVEGSIDCIRMHQHGYCNTVAILGNNLSEKQKRLIVKLRPKSVYLFFDADAGGVRAIESAQSLSAKYPVKVVKYPKGTKNYDPAKLESSQIDAQLRKAVPLLRVMRDIKRVRKGGTIRIGA